VFPPLATEFLLAPNTAPVLYTVLVLTGIVGSVITAAKGRWGWLVIDMITLGLAGNLTASLRATPRSVWARRLRGATLKRRG